MTDNPPSGLRDLSPRRPRAWNRGNRRSAVRLYGISSRHLVQDGTGASLGAFFSPCADARKRCSPSTPGSSPPGRGSFPRRRRGRTMSCRPEAGNPPRLSSGLETRRSGRPIRARTREPAAGPRNFHQIPDGPSLSFPLQIIEAQVHGDPVKPGGKPRLFPESPDLPKSPQKRLLGQVVGVSMVPGEPEDRPVNPFPVPSHELGISFQVALLGPADKPFVGDIVNHAAHIIRHLYI